MSQLNDIIAIAENITLYRGGDATTYFSGDDGFAEIIKGWNTLCDCTREMPALGVSLNDETVAAMKKGIWVEFAFDKQYSYNDLKFEKLLVEVNKQWQGFNIIRYNANVGYSGRCFYFDLVNKNMSDFYDILANI